MAVAVRAAANWTQKRISENLRISEKTLRANFSRELSHGRMMLEGMMLDVRVSKMMNGHLPSLKSLEEKIDATPLPSAGRPSEPQEVEQEAETPEDVATPKGKKEQRAAAAKEVPSEYGELYERLRGGPGAKPH